MALLITSSRPFAPVLIILCRSPGTTRSCSPTFVPPLPRRRAEEENLQLKRTLKQRYNFANIVGKSEGMLRIFDLVAQVAPSRSTVLIQGESGTGKEIIAKAIHANSPRRDKPFVPSTPAPCPQSCSSRRSSGTSRGAFTSAIASKKGLFEVANGGTLFLDEIATMGLDTQSKILRVLQDKRFMHLGGIQELQVDVRILAATNVDLRQAVRDGRFREDLFYRLNVITVDLPPLRSRREDIPLLVQHFLEFYAAENNFPPRKLSSDAMRASLITTGRAMFASLRMPSNAALCSLPAR
ncbi:MAG: sigma 54-interacting transcriptional regulator [Terracidiphilus sp.]